METIIIFFLYFYFTSNAGSCIIITIHILHRKVTCVFFPNIYYFCSNFQLNQFEYNQWHSIYLWCVHTSSPNSIFCNVSFFSSYRVTRLDEMIIYCLNCNMRDVIWHHYLLIIHWINFGTSQWSFKRLLSHFQKSHFSRVNGGEWNCFT